MFCQYMCSLGIEPTTFALLTTEPQEHFYTAHTHIYYAQNKNNYLRRLISINLNQPNKSPGGIKNSKIWHNGGSSEDSVIIHNQCLSVVHVCT